VVCLGLGGGGGGGGNRLQRKAGFLCSLNKARAKGLVVVIHTEKETNTTKSIR